MYFCYSGDEFNFNLNHLSYFMHFYMLYIETEIRMHVK